MQKNKTKQNKKKKRVYISMGMISLNMLNDNH